MSRKLKVELEVSERKQYKETWNKLAENFEAAKLHVTGDANEKELKNSSHETISRINRYVNFTKGDIVLELDVEWEESKRVSSRCKKWIGCDISGICWNMLKAFVTSG